ncbi:MAG: hypothetical protein Q9207_007522 [Kuettlingeria erythrocarpa]
MSSYKLHNPSSRQPTLSDPLPTTFNLRTPPGVDIWRKPPSTNDFNAPLLLRNLPLPSLRSARVTVSAPWRTKFDQGGLLLVLPGEEGQDRKQRRWIKTGVEFFDGKPNISTVACDRWADWSLAPLPDDASEKVTVEVTREVQDGEKTSTLWVHYINPSTGEKRPLREVAWVFEEEKMKTDLECEIGVYAAKPIADESKPENELDVTFEGLSVETW